METKKITNKKQSAKKPNEKASFAKIVLACSILAYIAAGLCLVSLVLELVRISGYNIPLVLLTTLQYLSGVVALATAIIGIVIGAQAVKRAGDIKGFTGTKARTIYLVLCIILLVAPFGGLGIIEELVIELISYAISLGLVLSIGIISTKYKQAILA